MFKLPPASSADTEQSTISALATAALAAPTGETETYLQREKLGEGEGEGAEAGAAMSASGSSVTREHVVAPAAEAEPRSSKLGLIVGGLVAVAAVAGVLVFVTGDEEGPAPSDATAEPEVDAGKLEASLGEAQALIGEGKFEAATDKVDAVRPKLGEAPQLEAKVERLDKAIELGKLLATARKLDEEGRTGAAISAYKDVLSADAANAEARARVAELEASIGSDEGLVKIASKPATAQVTIDGLPSGSTPFDKALPLGKHTLVISADGYESWERKIEVKAGDNPPLEVELEKLPADDKKKPAKKKPSTTAETKKKPAETKKKPAETKKKPAKEEKDNPFLPTKKNDNNGPFLPTEK